MSRPRQKNKNKQFHLARLHEGGRDRDEQTSLGRERHTHSATAEKAYIITTIIYSNL